MLTQRRPLVRWPLPGLSVWRLCPLRPACEPVLTCRREPHQGRDRALCYCVNVATVWGRIMKMMTREQLFAAPKLLRRGKGRLERGMEAVSAARTRATEIAQQCAALPKLIPTASHRRRLARLRASVS